MGVRLEVRVVKFDLIIFDCDGVLLDSETIALRVYSEVLACHGTHISPAKLADRYAGLATAQVKAGIEKEIGHALPPEFDTAYEALLNRTFADVLRPMHGVKQMLGLLRRRGFKLCVASSSSVERLKFTLGLVNLWGLFAPHIYSTSMVRRGKPWPDIFRHAAQVLEVAPSRCLVIEDSVPGIQAAVAAGMVAYGFLGGSHRSQRHRSKLFEAGATLVFNDFSEMGSHFRATER